MSENCVPSLKKRRLKAHFQATSNGVEWKFKWDPDLSMLMVWKKRSRRKLLMSADNIIDLAVGQMRLPL